MRAARIKGSFARRSRALTLAGRDTGGRDGVTED